MHIGDGSDEPGQSYLGELRANLRPLLAASLGIGGGLNLFAYAASIMAPHLVEEFGWSRSQFALVGLTMFTTLLVLPFVGRMTDTLGVRVVATLGAVLTPASIACFSLMDGPFYHYLVVSTGVLAVGTLGTPVVYTRLIAANFHRARGLALTIATCAPALLGAIGAPVLSDFVDAHGWRTGYRVLALFLLLLGLASVLLIAPGRRDERTVPREGGEPRRQGRAVFAAIARNRVFWLIAIAMFLCTLQTPLHSAQLNLMLLDNHISTGTAARIVSVYAIGTVIGRIACGLALDKFATYLVAAASMVLPAIGYAVLASDLDAVAAIAFAMFLVGLAVGAEADLLSYLVARYFRLEIYSTVASLVYSAVFMASATGAVTLSLTLRLTDSFSLFLWLVSLTILCGSLLLLRLRHAAVAAQLQSADGAEAAKKANGPVAATP